MIRQRSAAKNLPELIGVINEKNSHRVFFSKIKDLHAVLIYWPAFSYGGASYSEFAKHL